MSSHRLPKKMSTFSYTAGGKNGKKPEKPCTTNAGT